MAHSKSFNYRITEFFLENTRLTILSFILLLVFGVAATVLLKTTGFPSPTINIAIVRTLYVGASSETVARTVTTPIEGVLKDVEGIESYASTSSNNVSIISVTMKDTATPASVLGKLDSAVSNVALPAGAEKPVVSQPSIGGFDFMFSVNGRNLGEIYNLKQRIIEGVSQNPATASINPLVDLKRQVLVRVDLDAMKKKGVTQAQIQSQLASIGEQLPVISDATIDDKSRSIVTSVAGTTLEDVRALEIRGGNGASTKVKLSDIAQVDLNYVFDGDMKSHIGLNNNGEPKVLTSVSLMVQAVSGTDLAKYTKDIEDLFESYENAVYINDYRLPSDQSKPFVIKDMSANDRNQVQVKEVVSGLIGGKLDANGAWGNVGWLLGGIQLVFLVMLAFVSWRAAIVAALAIPFSLVFSNIYLMLIGESLNTLVLFSLVLVIGLVVDPTLVILESIQRKIDTGLRGKDAALAAIRDTGMGLFLATLTNIIVFAPFAVVSGIMGQIFSYIPLTIIPAIIGSYVVPLIFLAWIGGLFLRPGKDMHDNEWDNLWGVARRLARANYRILTGSRWLRVVIILGAIVVPIMITGYLFSSGKIKPAQFAAQKNAQYGSITGNFLPDTTKGDREALTQKVLQIVSDNPAVENVFPQTSGFSYFIVFKPVAERKTYTSEQAIVDINASFQRNPDIVSEFFDLKAGVLANGPPAGDYQVSIAVKTNDLNLLAKDAQHVGAIMQALCLNGKSVVVSVTCTPENRVVAKVDDGFTKKENTVYEVIVDRQKLADKHLVVAGAPFSFLVNRGLKQLFSINDGKKVGVVDVGGEQTDIVMDKQQDDPKTLEEIENAVIVSMGPLSVKVKDVATVTEKKPKSDIQHVKGETVGVVKARLATAHADQGTALLVTNAIVDYYKNHSATLGGAFKNVTIESYSEGGTASFTKSFSELIVALLLAIILTYFVLAVFFNSMTLPIVILFTIPLSFIGIFPALYFLGTGEFGFLEIIGMIILVGIIENVAIFLIDAARQYIHDYEWDEKRSISYASGIRFRPVILTKLTAIASLAPLAFLSQQYRSMSIVIIFGLLTSGITSLFTTPILFVFFRWLSRRVRGIFT